MNGSVAARMLPFALLSGCAGPATPVDPAPSVPESHDLIIGGDISFLPEIEDHGGSYPDDTGARDLLPLLRDHGFSSIRLKLWHTPDGSYNTLARVREMATRIDAAGMTFLLDIHYSDTWADPAHQSRPAAWDGVSFDTLVDSVYWYSCNVIASLGDQGTLPAMVQIGNEIRAGILWPDGRVGGVFDTPEQWNRLAALLDAGRRGVVDGASGSTPGIMIHLDAGGDNAVSRWFLDHLVERGLVFDAIGLSYYPAWPESLTDLGVNLTDLARRYARDVYVVEAAYPWTLSWSNATANIIRAESQLHPGFPATPAEQGAFLRALGEVVGNVPGERERGVYYWAPEWIPVEGVGSAWENVTMFDFGGRMLPSLEAYTGAK